MNGHMSINMELSNPFSVTNGVNQGTILVPTFFKLSFFVKAATMEALRVAQM